jgi:hypothetical protein
VKNPAWNSKAALDSSALLGLKNRCEKKQGSDHGQRNYFMLLRLNWDKAILVNQKKFCLDSGIGWTTIDLQVDELLLESPDGSASACVLT